LETLRGGRDPGLCPVATCKDLGYLLDRTAAQADLHERSDEDSHHLAQERVAADVDLHALRIGPRDGDRVDAPHRRLGRAAGRAKWWEVVLADERAGGALHRDDRERLPDMPRAVAPRRRSLRACEDRVAVVLAGRGEPRMKVVRDLRGIADRDLRRQV